MILIAIHVDDSYLASSCELIIEELKNHLRLKFTIKFNDIIHTYLRVQHTLNDSNALRLSQSNLLSEPFAKLNITSKTDQMTVSISNAKCDNLTDPYSGAEY
jgi:hypothetical protein